MIARPHSALVSILLKAYRPCSLFGSCPEARWEPRLGHMPRGFLGATGQLDDVGVVLVSAQPAAPHHDERHDTDLTPMEFFDRVLKHVYDCYAECRDEIHRNTRWFVDQLYPDLRFDQQLKHVWIAQSRLCSMESTSADNTCTAQYLGQQLDLFPRAAVVALGSKSQQRIKRLARDAIPAYSFGPPGANHRPAKPSWENAIRLIKARRPAIA